MGFVDYVIIAIIAAIIGFAISYIIKAKKSGKKCIGCPDGGSCEGSCSSCRSSGASGCRCCTTENSENKTESDNK